MTPRKFRAPGRVNLIGEHTDYNLGFVLPVALDLDCRVQAEPRADGKLHLASEQEKEEREWPVDALASLTPGRHWSDYVVGVAQQLQKSGFEIEPQTLRISSTVPVGAGLSSSAALEVSSALALLNGRPIDKLHLARLCQRAENQFVGMNCGIMDQLIAARGEPGSALLIDCRSLEARAVPLPADGVVMIVHSHVKRGLVDSEYNTRRAQCEAAVRHYGVKALRDLDIAGLERGADGLDPVVLRRARHIVTENQRTLDAAAALAKGDYLRLGALMAESHASMRDDFEITVEPIDRLVEIIKSAVGIEGGVRMTGGGFGGCVVALLPDAMVAPAKAAVAARYRAPGGAPASVYVCHASPGAGLVKESSHA